MLCAAAQVSDGIVEMFGVVEFKKCKTDGRMGDHME
jgi:hypothetical protein